MANRPAVIGITALEYCCLDFHSDMTWELRCYEEDKSEDESEDEQDDE